MQTEPETNPLAEIFGDTIHTYSRAQALEDGFLIDVTARAREAGIKYPVAITSAAWAECVAWTPADRGRWKSATGAARLQDQEGRLWDVLWMLACAMRACPSGRDTLMYRLRVVDREIGRSLVKTLKAAIGPGDDGLPVVTVMLPLED